MNKVAVVVPPYGFSGASLLSLLRGLEEHGIEHVVVSRRRGPICDDRGTSATATLAWTDVDPAAFDAIAVVDGEDEALEGVESVASLLRTAHQAGKVVAGIGQGVLALANAGLLRECAVAADAASAERLRQHGAGPVLEPVTSCGRVVTAVDGAGRELASELAELRTSESQRQPA